MSQRKFGHVARKMCKLVFCKLGENESIRETLVTTWMDLSVGFELSFNLGDLE
jgi:hypothetical protein